MSWKEYVKTRDHALDILTRLWDYIGELTVFAVNYEIENRLRKAAKLAEHIKSDIEELYDLGVITEDVRERYTDNADHIIHTIEDRGAIPIGNIENMGDLKMWLMSVVAARICRLPKEE